MDRHEDPVNGYIRYSINTNSGSYQYTAGAQDGRFSGSVNTTTSAGIAQGVTSGSSTVNIGLIRFSSSANDINNDYATYLVPKDENYIDVVLYRSEGSTPTRNNLVISLGWQPAYHSATGSPTFVCPEPQRKFSLQSVSNSGNNTTIRFLNVTDLSISGCNPMELTPSRNALIVGGYEVGDIQSGKDTSNPNNRTYIKFNKNSSSISSSSGYGYVQIHYCNHAVLYRRGNYGTGDDINDATFKVQGRQAIKILLSDGHYTRSGYVQTGWSTSPSGTTKNYNFYAIIEEKDKTSKEILTLYPYWERPTYTISYSYNPDEYKYDVTPKQNFSQTKTYNNSLTLLGIKYSRNGYKQSGWTTSASGIGGTFYALGATYTTNAAITLYPTWEVDSYDITLNANGGTFVEGSDVQTTTYEVTVGQLYGDLPTPTYLNHRFEGWYTSSGDRVYNSTTVPTTSVGTLYAHWTRLYTITFQGGEGATVMPGQEQNLAQYKAHGENFHFPIQELFQKSGANQVSWLLISGGTPQEYPLGADKGVYTTDADATFEAVWSSEFVIRYRPGEYSNEKDLAPNDYFLPSSDYKLRGAIYTRTGFSQQAWASDVNGLVFFDDLGASYSQAENKFLYPFWVADFVRVTYLPNFDISTDPIIQTYTYGQSNQKFLTLPPSWSRPNFDFKGWSEIPNAFEPTWLGGEAVLDTWVDVSPPEKTFYAIWRGTPSIVTFNANGGVLPSGTTSSRTVYYGSPYGDLPVPTRTDYYFLGWYTAATGGTRIRSDTLVNTTSNHTLYAHWTEGGLVNLHINGRNVKGQWFIYLDGEWHLTLSQVYTKGTWKMTT